jgi:hypothetical protein
VGVILCSWAVTKLAQSSIINLTGYKLGTVLGKRNLAIIMTDAVAFFVTNCVVADGWDWYGHRLIPFYCLKLLFQSKTIFLLPFNFFVGKSELLSFFVELVKFIYDDDNLCLSFTLRFI